MFLRMVTHAIRSDESEGMAETYGRTVIAALRTVPGCSFASLLQNTADPQECVSLTLWGSPADSARYEESGRYTELVDALRPFFVESNEWKLELSADLSLEYTPVQVEPTVERFSDPVAGSDRIARLRAKPFAVQIFALSVLPEKTAEFEALVTSAVLPRFRARKGFIDLVLLRHGREYHALSFWDETVDDRSVASAQAVNEFAESIAALLPSFVRRQAVRPGSLPTMSASEGMSVRMYRCLTAEWF